MSNMESKELLQAKALGCLEAEDDALITKLMNEDENFPWQELGHYQNLVAFLPTLFDVEIPDPEVKDSVARKLYELGEKIKAEKEGEVKHSTITKESEANKIEEEGFILEEEPIEKVEIQEVTKDATNVGYASTGISIKEHGAIVQKPSMDEKKVIREPVMKKQQGTPQTKAARIHQKKEFELKSDESYRSKFSGGSGIGESSTSKNRFILTILLFAVTLLGLIFVYFILSSDIQENKDKIERLEKQIGTEIILDNTLLHKSFIT